jgi:hypothetical protein
MLLALSCDANRVFVVNCLYLEVAFTVNGQQRIFLLPAKFVLSAKSIIFSEATVGFSVRIALIYAKSSE